jgi:hypothetical protein
MISLTLNAIAAIVSSILIIIIFKNYTILESIKVLFHVVISIISIIGYAFVNR